MTARDRDILQAIAKATPNVVTVVFGVVCAALILRALVVAPLPVSLDPNEGWNAYLAAAAMSGAKLYPSAQSDFVNNYPPLSFYVTGAFGQFLHDNILAGRIISLLSFCAILAGIWRLLAHMQCRIVACVLALLFFAASLLVGSDYVGMDDPELFGHALDTAGLLLLFSRPRQTMLSALLFATAFFIKHNLVAMPIAAALWLAVYARDRAFRFVGSGLAFALAGLIAFRVAYHAELFSQLASPRTYSFALLGENVGRWLTWYAIPAFLFFAFAYFHRRDRFVALCAFYVIIAIVIGVAFSGGAGVDINVFFDADIALALGLGLAMDRLALRDVRWLAGIAASLFLVLVAGLYAASDDNDWSDPDFWFHPLGDETDLSRSDITFLKSHPGAALCETLALCYWAGKPATVDVFNIGEAIARGARSDNELIIAMQKHRFAAIEFDTLEPFALGPRVHRALLSAYRVDHKNDDGVFLLPR